MALTLLMFGSSCKSSEPVAKKPAKTQPKVQVPTTLEGFFQQDFAHSMKLDIADEAMEALREHPRRYAPATFRFGTKSYQVSIKLKGNRSFRDIDDKPAIKIRFNKQDPEANFFGLTRLTLNNMTDDPTRMREALGYQMFRAAGVPAPRTAYTFLNINNQDLGIYLALEPMDKVFVASHFSEPIGGLYEAEYGCDLYPSDVEKFERDCGPKSSRDQLAVIAQLAAESRPGLLREDSPYFDSAMVLSYLAVSTLIADFDGYWHSHNYYLYQNGKDGKWLLLPWGLDRVFHDKVQIFASRGRLAELCFADEGCLVAYSKRLLEVATLMETENLASEMRRLFQIMGPSANQDPRDDTTLEKRLRKKRRMRDFIQRRPAEIRESLRCLVDGVVVDSDNDGYGCNDCAVDDPKINPGATEVCDEVDNDCNGIVDDAPECACETIVSQGATFHLCEWRLSWSEARDFCKAKGLSLAKLDSAAQSLAVQNAALDLDDNRWWLGASDLAKEGTWRWLDGSRFGWSNWASSYPRDDQCGQDCASFNDVDHDGTWVDSHCEQNYPFVCR